MSTIQDLAKASSLTLTPPADRDASSRTQRRLHHSQLIVYSVGTYPPNRYGTDELSCIHCGLRPSLLGQLPG